MTFDGHNAARQLAHEALANVVPVESDEAWLRRFVDAPRFGWDWPALERGFFGPLRAWSQRYDTRLRPTLAIELMQALGAAPERYRDALAALEMHYLASIMLDDLRNGRDLASSTDAAVDVQLPVWVTVAYNARQLAPVLVMRGADDIAPLVRRRLAQRFAAFLFRQGIGSALDLWADEQSMQQHGVGELTEHLLRYTGPLSFGLCAEFAGVAAGLDDEPVAVLAQAAQGLGVAARLHALARGDAEGFASREPASREQKLRWRGRHPAQALDEAAAALRDAALLQAAAVSPPASEAMRDFFERLAMPAREAMQ